VFTHVTVSGRTVEFDPSPKMAALLDRLSTMLRDPRISIDEMIRVAYAPDNPLFDPLTSPGQSGITKKTLDDPSYHVMVDLLYRKQMAETPGQS
jgi:hypothetical protein